MKRTTIMAEEELLYKIEKIARREGKSKAAVIREALMEYVAVAEAKNPPENPLMRLVGLAGDDGIETDFSDGKDEDFIMNNLHPIYGFAARDEKDTN